MGETTTTIGQHSERASGDDGSLSFLDLPFPVSRRKDKNEYRYSMTSCMPASRTDQKIWEKLWNEKHEGKMLLREVIQLENEFDIDVVSESPARKTASNEL